MSRQADGPRRASDAAGCHGDDPDDDPGTLVTVASDPFVLGAAEVDTEMELCLRLRDWDPWSAPSPELLFAITALKDHDVNRHGRGPRCLMRSAAIEQIALEAVASDQMPEWMQYHACARYWLQKGRVTTWGGQSSDPNITKT